MFLKISCEQKSFQQIKKFLMNNGGGGGGRSGGQRERERERAYYCIEGIEMRQRSCKVRRLLFLKRY
jgi:hypothetical protein